MNNGRPALRFNTEVPLNVIESFLDKECHAGWDLKLEGIADDLNKKVVKITFSTADDAAKFKAEYKKLKTRY